MAAITFDVGRKKAAFSLGAQELATKDRLLKDNVTVDPIAVARVENPAGGKTIFIGGIFDG